MSNQTQQVRVGFEAALDKFIPNWKELPQGVVDSYRSFYAQAIQDARIFAATATDTLKRGFDYFDKSLTEEGMVPQVEPVSTKKAKPTVKAKKAPKGQAKSGVKTPAKAVRKH